MKVYQSLSLSPFRKNFVQMPLPQKVLGWSMTTSGLQVAKGLELSSRRFTVYLIITTLCDRRGIHSLSKSVVQETTYSSWDNEAAVNIITEGPSSPPFINRFLKRLTWSCIMGNISLCAAHLPGLDNKTADASCRFKFQEFRDLCPHAAP